MKLFAIALLIIALSKLFIASDDRKVELKKLVSGLPVQADLVDPFTKCIIVLDGLLEIICGILIISAL